MPGPALPAPAGMPAHLRGLARTLVMGVVNVTPDSFSDGGDFLDPDAAVARGLALVADGADLVDVGGESTRPGAQRVAPAEELRRVLPVVQGLVAEGVVVSIDTMRASVAAAALEAGAALVNDVSGGLADEAMARVVADAGSPYVVMHWRGHSADMASRAVYDDVVTEVLDELQGRLDDLAARRCRPRPASSSTRGSASRRTPTTTGRCSRTSPTWPGSAARCSSVPPARASSASC